MFQHLVHKALGANSLTAQTRPSGFNRGEHFAPLLRQIADYPSSEIESGPSATNAAGTEMIEKKSSVTVSWESLLTARTWRTLSDSNQMDRMELLRHVSNIHWQTVRVGGRPITSPTTTTTTTANDNNNNLWNQSIYLSTYLIVYYPCLSGYLKDACCILLMCETRPIEGALSAYCLCDMQILYCSLLLNTLSTSCCFLR